jgi:hypothetical protein
MQSRLLELTADRPPTPNPPYSLVFIPFKIRNTRPLLLYVLRQLFQLNTPVPGEMPGHTAVY